jgi:hypothetical protein
MSTLDIYMKSGNVIRVKNVKDWSFRSNGNEVIYLKVEQGKSIFRSRRGLIISTIDLSQIEGVAEL